METPAFEAYKPKTYSANGQRGDPVQQRHRVGFVARSKHQVRGFSVDLLLVEEAMILTDAAWSSLMPALGARDGQGILASRHGSAAHQRGPATLRHPWRSRPGQRSGPFRVVRALDAAPDSDEAIAQANPAWVGCGGLGHGGAPGHAARGLRTGIMGWWREDETPSPFPPGAWDALAYLGHLEVVGTPCFSVDVTPTRDHSTIAVAANPEPVGPLSRS